MTKDESSRNNKKKHENKKQKQMDQYRRKNTGPGKKLTSDAGLKISNDRWSLRAGKRGPTLFQDFHFYKKQSHFNRERIPEKVVQDRKSTRLNSSHVAISYAVFCLIKKKVIS